MKFQGKGVLFKNDWRQSSGTGFVPNFDVNCFEKYSFSYGTSQTFVQVQNRFSWSTLNKLLEKTIKNMWRSIGKGVLFKTFDVKVQVHFVPEKYSFSYRTSHMIYLNFDVNFLQAECEHWFV